MESRVVELATQVREVWLAEGLPVVEPDLGHIPAALRERLPREFLTFLTVAGLPAQPDSKLIEFWSPTEWEQVDDSLLIFADYLISSHVYALRLSGVDEGKVSLLLGLETDPQPPIGTVAEFLSAYLADDSALYE